MAKIEINQYQPPRITEEAKRASYISWREAVNSAARLTGATPTGIPGLWNVPGYGELTANQLLQVASR